MRKNCIKNWYRNCQTKEKGETYLLREMDKLYDLCKEVGLDTIGEDVNYTLRILADPGKWKKNRLDEKIKKEGWKTAKYLNSKGYESAEFRAITKEHGGIFLWVIMPNLIPLSNCCFVAYVGESEKNLNKSIHSFIKSSANSYKGQLSTKQLFERYSGYLHLVYYENDEEMFLYETVSKLVEALQPLIMNIPINIQQTGEEF